MLAMRRIFFSISTVVITSFILLRNIPNTYAGKSTPLESPFKTLRYDDPTYKSLPIISNRLYIPKEGWAAQKNGVYTAKLDIDSKPAFIKCIRESEWYTTELKFLKRIETAISSSFKCNLPTWTNRLFLKLYDSFVTENNYGCTVTSSRHDMMDLFTFHFLQKPVDRYKYAMHIFQQLTVGISYLHCLKIAHADIKLENILVYKDEDGTPYIKIIDFDLSVDMAITHVGKLKCNTFGTCSPETLLGNPPSGDWRKVDSWAIAVTMYDYLNGIFPYGGGGPNGGTSMERIDYERRLEWELHSIYQEQFPVLRRAIDKLFEPLQANRMIPEQIISQIGVHYEQMMGARI
ncbi:kinase-like domain-containing protein [Syncephalis fuscata]|nr:kinase-like domain-containing protein [Syncephalis fuscata]